MKFDLDQSITQIKEGDLISLPHAAGSTLAVMWGKVWLTQDGHPRDYDLSTGESFTIHGDGLILVSALENSAICLLRPCKDFTASWSVGSKNAGNAARLRAANHSHGIRYISGKELEQFKRTAHELRAQYIGSLFASLIRAFGRGLTKIGTSAVAVWIKHARNKWMDPRDRLNLS